jgi:N-acetylglucosamine-6-phosphate deacetylase
MLDGYVDLQVNGFVGVDFNDPQVTAESIEQAAVAMQREGVAAALPTVITSSLSSMLRCIRVIRNAIESQPTAAQLFHGIHVEGPFLSPVSGYIGAHPVEHALVSDPGAMEQLLDAGGGWVRLVTLAPEVDGEAVLTRLCAERGILVAAGHTNASLEQLERCIDAGLTLFTHLGNGCPRLMDRHDNIIIRGLRLRERLTYTLIADGFHIPQVLFENLLDWVPLEKLCVVSDAISAAGLGPGTFRLGSRTVAIGPDKAARDPSGEHFVGAASSMRDADRWLNDSLHLDEPTRRRLLIDNPQRLLRATAAAARDGSANAR